MPCSSMRMPASSIASHSWHPVADRAVHRVSCRRPRTPHDRAMRCRPVMHRAVHRRPTQRRARLYRAVYYRAMVHRPLDCRAMPSWPVHYRARHPRPVMHRPVHHGKRLHRAVYACRLSRYGTGGLPGSEPGNMMMRFTGARAQPRQRLCHRMTPRSVPGWIPRRHTHPVNMPRIMPVAAIPVSRPPARHAATRGQCGK